MKRVSMELTNNQKKDLEAIRNLPDNEIDTSDAPEVLDWSRARRGLLYRPVFKEITLSLDQYVLEWFESAHPAVEDRHEAINKVLMEHIRDCEFPSKKGEKVVGNQE